MVQGRKRNLARVQWIGELRARGWTFARIAEKAGVSPQAIHHALCSSSRRHLIARCRLCRESFPAAGAMPGDDLAVACPRCLAPDAPFVERIRSYRLAAGMTRAELARRSGVCPTLLRHYENAVACPRLDKLTRLIEVLGIGIVAHASTANNAAG
jgi:transcriptional regulator with XRE-family HTH domain